MKTVLPCSSWLREGRNQHADPAKLPLPPRYLRPFSEVDTRCTMNDPNGGSNPIAITPSFGRDCVAAWCRRADVVDRRLIAADTNSPCQYASPLSMSRFLGPILLAAAVVTLPAMAQTPPASPSKPPAAPAPQNPMAPATPPATPAAPPAANAPIPLPAWFKEIDTANKGEVTREQFVKYRMKTFDQLDTNHDGKLSLDEFLKVAEPPFTTEGPGVPPLEERKGRARAEFQNLDTNRNGFVERAEAEALVHAEFNQYDTDRDNKVTEPEVQRRRGMMAINDFIDMQLRSADQLDKNGDGKITQQEWLAIAGPADGPQAQGLPPFELRK